MVKPRILLVQLEFGTWDRARAWSYLGNFSVEDGLRANGCECVTIPALCDIPDTSPSSWLHHAKDLLAGQCFDQVWVWLVHNRYSEAFLGWLTGLAPVRVGLIMESLRYSDEDCRRWPHLRERAGLAERQVSYMTHVLTADEHDAEMFNQAGLVQALFWPSAVPSRFITTTIQQPSRREAAFYGELYGERKAWLAMPGLKDLLIHPPPAEAATEFPLLFNALHQQMAERLQSGWRPHPAALTEYVGLWRRLREAIFVNWLASLKPWSAIVNLPSLFQSYAGRVVEAMAAGRPVISWKIPDRLRTQDLFKAGREILLYPRDRPVVLEQHVKRIARDADFARNIAEAASAELLRSHTAEARARQWLDWIETGQPPVAPNATAEAAVLDASSSRPFSKLTVELSDEEIRAATTVFVLTGDGPAFAACLEALRKQDGPPFKLDIIRNVCSFSAAAQAMIDRCRTPYFIQVDEDMVLAPDAVASMENVMAAAPDDVGMICFHLFDEDRGMPIQGVKIYRTALIKALTFQDVKASEIDLLEQMSRHGLQWILHPDVKGLHGTVCTPDTIYRRYKTMYEKDIRQWNVLTSDIRRKADAFRQSGDPLQLFALLGAVHGIINAPLAADPEKDARAYDFVELDVFKRLFLTDPPMAPSYAAAQQALAAHKPIPFERVQWKGGNDRNPPPQVEPESGEMSTAGNGSQISDPADQVNGGVMNSDSFYVNLFVNAPAWSAPQPNADESARWSKIAAFLEYILRRVQQSEPGRRLRILDVGCGRGWLTNLATMYGSCEGIEPVAGVVEHARKLFPHLRFEAGTAEVVSERADFEPYDVILTSEVIEHVPHGQKENFLAQLFRLLKPDGYVVLTTPRGEMWEQWKTIAPPNQPVEDWVTEEQLRVLFTSQGFVEMGLDRIHVEVPGLRYVPAPTPADLRSMNLLPIYQVWVCQRTVDRIPVPFTRTPKVSVIVPTYNRPDRLRTALASLAAQTYQDFEVIIVNDAGCDVGAVVAACVDRCRIMTITHDRNRGLAAARNSGLRAAKGTYIAYLDDDDRYLPNHLETLVGYLDRHECRVAYTDAWRVQERWSDGGYVETGRDVPYSYDFKPAELLVSNYFPVLCVMHDRACLDEVGLFDESLFAHEDWDLWIRMATRFPFKHLPIRTAEFTWRTDGSSMTSGTRETYRRTTEIIYRKYRPYADRIGGVRQAQDKRLTEMRTIGDAKRYTCSIIMPVCNRMELTKDCLTALAELKDQPEYELIIVDNGSTDGTTDFLRQLSGDVRTIANEENLGFAKACNQGAAAARGKYLVFLNNDTIPQPGWLTALVAEVDSHAEVGIVGSKLLYPDGTVQHAGVVRDCARRLPYHIYKNFAASHPAVNQRREFQIVTAACLLIRRALFEEVEGFDEEYVNGFEDADLCLKAQERGYVVVYQPRSVVIHLESQTPGRKLHDDANVTRFLDRWKAQWWAADEDLHFHVSGFKLKRVFRHGREGSDIHMFNDIKDRAAWAHVAATQAAALKQDWPAVKRELSLAADWPDDPAILAWASFVCEHLQEPTLRQSFLSRYLALEEAPNERLSLIRSLLKEKDLQGADSHLQSLLSSSPNHAEGLLLKGILCMQREQYEQAERAFASARQEGADRKKCLMGMGMAAMGRSYTQGAWERFLEVLAENPDDAEAIHWLLRAGAAQNRWRELGEQLHRYVTRNPGDLAVRFAFAGVLLRGEQIEAARRECDALRTLAPDYDGLDQLGQMIAGKQAVLLTEGANDELIHHLIPAESVKSRI